MNTKIIKLDINRRFYDKIVAKQDDTGSRFLLFQLLDGAVPFNLADRNVRVYGVKPDGSVVFNDLTVTHSTTGFCLLELTNQMLAIAGIVKLELMITEGDKKLTSIPFEMEVIKKINSNAAVESSNEFGALLTALKEIDQWNREFADKSGKLEELYTPRLNELGSQLDSITHLITSNLTQVEVKNILETKKNIKVCEGIYDFSNLIIMQDNVNIVFEKNAKLNYIGSELIAIKLGSNSTLSNFNLVSQNKVKNSYGIQANGKNNINIIGGTIDGFGFANIGIVECKGVNIQSVNSINCGNKADGSDWYGQGIWVNTSEDVIINGNNIKDNGMHGVQVIGSKNVIATDNICNENGDCGITINTVDIFKIADNICEHNGVNGGKFGGQGIQIVGNSTTKSKDGTITGNTCRNNLENGIEVTTYCEDIAIDDNVSKYNNWAGIAVNPNCDTVTVSDNICKYNQNGISCKNANVLQLTGNITNNNKENGVSINTCECVNVENYISLNNGQTVNDRCGILVTASTNVDVKNGKAYDTQDTKTQSHGVRYYNTNGGECSGNTLTGNKVNTLLLSGSNIIINNKDDESISTKGIKDKNGIRVLSGSSTPQGTVVANKGSIYIRTDGNRATSIYLKTEGTGATGWDYLQVIASGSAEYRPIGVVQGFLYYDTSIGKPIWWGGSSWKDVNGVVV